MSISFDKSKIIKWSGSAAKLLALIQALLAGFTIYQLITLYPSLSSEIRNSTIVSAVSNLLFSLLQALVFFGYSRLVTEFLDKKDEKRS